jgi:hypothetical protein
MPAQASGSAHRTAPRRIPAEAAPPPRRPLPSDPAARAWTVVAHLTGGPAVSPFHNQTDATRLFERLRRISPFIRFELFCAGKAIEVHVPTGRWP